MFESVSVLDCVSKQIGAIRAAISNALPLWPQSVYYYSYRQRSILVFSVYMPTDTPDNLTYNSIVLTQ